MLLAHFLQTHPAACIAAAALLGLVAGSFLNVVIVRLPRVLEREWQWEAAQRTGDDEASSYYAGERFGLVAPRSRCPGCARPIRPWDNIPVLSFLWLRGRCRACGWRIPLRYPAVELLSAAASALVAWHFGYGAPMAGALVLTFALIALAFIDFDTHLLPDAITLPVLWLGLSFNLFGVHATLHSSVLGAIVGYGILWTTFHVFRLFTGKEGMGHGDFKLLAMLGAWLGWQSLPLVILLSSVAGVVLGAAMIALGRQDHTAPMPFGPFLAAAGWLCLLFGDPLTEVYLEWVAGVA